MKRKISASFLGSKKVAKVLVRLNLTDVDYIHVDVMDGKYVKYKTMPYTELCDITYYTRKRLDIHFMVRKPLKIIDDYATLNVEYMTFHLDIKNNLEDVFKKCHEYGIKIGLALNPKDEIEEVLPYLDKINLVLVMGVEPGKSGQEFIPETIQKVEELKKEIKKRNLKTLISVDGGVNLENSKDLKEADILVSGSTILNSDDYQNTITELRNSKLEKNSKKEKNT